MIEPGSRHYFERILLCLSSLFFFVFFFSFASLPNSMNIQYSSKLVELTRLFRLGLAVFDPVHI